MAAVLSGLLSGATPAAPHDGVRTKDGHIACEKREWMEDMLTFIRTKNTARYRNYIETRKCLFMKGDVEVKIVESEDIAGVVVAFEYNRKIMWTYWSSLTYER